MPCFQGNKMSLIEHLVSRIQEAKNAYAKGESIMTDAEYDKLEAELRARDPNNPILRQVGARIEAGEAIRLPIPMPSLAKIDPTNLSKWLAKNPADAYQLSDKLDGISALWMPAFVQGSRTVNGKLYTHGANLEGRDISDYVRSIRGLVMSPFPVRGEIVMKKTSKAVVTSARNTVAGVFARKKSFDQSVLSEVVFVAHDVLTHDMMVPSDAFQKMRDFGYVVAYDDVIDKAGMTAEILSEYFAQRKRDSEYDLDGIVIVPDIPRDNLAIEIKDNGVTIEAVDPKDKVAWKTGAGEETVDTNVIAVEWKVSAGNLIKPTVFYRKIKLGDSQAERATGFNAKWIIDNGVGPGAKIRLKRAGSVIPYIVEVVEPSPTGPQMPEIDYEIRGVEAVVIGASKEQEIAELLRALNTLGAENVGPSTVAKLYNAGFETIADVFNGTVGEFKAKLPSTGDKMAERIYNGLRAGKPMWNIVKFMVASNKFPHLVGATKLTAILDLFPDPYTWTADAIVARRPAGISADTIDAIVESLPAYFDWYEDNIVSVFGDIANPEGNPEGNFGRNFEEDTESEQDSLRMAPAARREPAAPAMARFAAPAMAAPAMAAPAMAARPGVKPTVVIALTGFRDASLEARYIVKDSVTKAVQYLVYKGTLKESTKTAKAKEYGIPIVEISQLP